MVVSVEVGGGLKGSEPAIGACREEMRSVRKRSAACTWCLVGGERSVIVEGGGGVGKS
jgi:hypothetical protein